MQSVSGVRADDSTEDNYSLPGENMGPSTLERDDPNSLGEDADGSMGAYALVVAGGNGGELYNGNVYRFQNGSLTLIGQPTTRPLRKVAWHPDGSYALIVGFEATVLKYDGATFTTLAPPIPVSQNLLAVAWRPDGQYALIAGSTGGTLLKYDGVSFTILTAPVNNTIRSVSWRSNSYATLVGDGGTMLIFENDTISSFPSGTISHLWAVSWNPNSQYAVAGGANGTILKHDGFSNTIIPTQGIYQPSHIVRSVGWNSSASALISGDDGLVLTYDGTALVRKDDPLTNPANMYSLDWSQGRATIVGGQGTVLEYSGTLQQLTTGLSDSLRGIDWNPQSTPLTIDFTVTPSSVEIGVPVVLATVVLGGSPPYSFNWTFGDSGTGTGDPVTHTYLAAGSMTVALTVTDSMGVSVTVNRTVRVITLNGDVNGDCLVNVTDLAMVGAAFGSTPASPNWNLAADLNRDGVVNILDLALVGSNFGRGCP